jgi:hypothetical protein
MPDTAFDPIDAYDSKHGKPEATPDAPAMSEADLYGTTLNPVRETPLAAANLKAVGK